MRNAFGLMLASVVAAVVIAGVWFWTSSPRADAAPPQTIAARKAEPLPPAAAAKAAKDDVQTTAALSMKPQAPRRPLRRPRRSLRKSPPAPIRMRSGLSRTVTVDTTGGPGFGFEHFKQLDFLNDKEVVLTFDDGPWPNNTPAGAEGACGGMHQGRVLRRRQARDLSSRDSQAVAAAGHTVGTHTWSHVNLNSKKLNEQQVRDEMEKGFSAVKMALGAAPAPFFRFPQLQHPAGR